MDFDLSKENIQPLRGGRNITQLGVAIQAQHNEHYQRELLQQKQNFEYAIHNYNGNDPLENWYQYIYWVEQSYPKHGHEGNLIPLLEDCLHKFEEDQRYANDIRFCKLWIKYIDVQQNPLELYHMMYSKHICRGCADLYRAWAFYYEASGDFQKANSIFQLGKENLAQPFEELHLAHQRMIFAAGQHVISGIDSNRLNEERRALTTLSAGRSGKVSSIRHISNPEPGVYHSNVPVSKSNINIPIYEDIGEPVRGAEAAPLSIITAARRHVAPKENTIKAGTWGAVPSLKPAPQRAPKFTVHEDNLQAETGLKLPPSFTASSQEDLSQWKPILFYAEPEDSTKIPMYPKSQVYSNNELEYSIEEIRAYRRMRFNRLNVSHIETEQAIQSILNDSGAKPKIHSISQVEDFYSAGSSTSYQQQSNYVQDNADIYHRLQNASYNSKPHQDVMSPHMQQSTTYQHNQPYYHMEPPPSGTNLYLTQNQHHNTEFVPNSQLHNHISQEHVSEHYGNMSHPFQENVYVEHQLQQPEMQYQTLQYHQNSNNLVEQMKVPSRVFGQNLGEASTSFHNVSVVQQSKLQNKELPSLGALWRSVGNDSYNDSLVEELPPKRNFTKFLIYEESNVQENVQPKGSAMRTPVKILTNEDLAETGSRGGHDIAGAAQPGDGAKTIEIFEDDSSSSFIENGIPGNAEFGNPLNTTCSTQMFNFNLNAMKVSTPQSKNLQSSNQLDQECAAIAKKKLFTEIPTEKQMSTIVEEESQRTSSSSGSTILKSSTFGQSKRENVMATISEDNSYHFNLTQNLKANAALRTSTILELMDCESAQQIQSKQVEQEKEISLAPLEKAPSNPFKPALLKILLDHMGFPGRYSDGYVIIHSTPRIGVRKEITNIGEDKYMVDKCLGKGTYGQVYKAVNLQTNHTVALKIQKPPHKWEFYICRELHARLNDDAIKDCFMNIYTGYFSDQISIFVSEFSPCGSLLELVNLNRQRNSHPLHQVMVIYFCIEMLKIISTLHQAKIIHADIKPDNFLVYILTDGTLQLQLIDFGASIDMSLFPPETAFTRRVTTKDFVCCEMLDGRPWNYHTDLFCIAATAHVLLFNNYLQMQKKNGCEWSITQRFTRYMRADLWNTFFSALLNQQKGPADPEHLIKYLIDSMHSFGDKLLNEEMRKLVNILNNQ